MNCKSPGIGTGTESGACRSPGPTPLPGCARKRPVNLTLNEDLVRQMKGTTDNLSAVVESLHARHPLDIVSIANDDRRAACARGATPAQTPAASPAPSASVRGVGGSGVH